MRYLTKHYKIWLRSLCSCGFEKFNAYLEKAECFKQNFQKISGALQFLNNFYISKTARRNENTIFHYKTNLLGRFVVHKYFSNFLGTVPTFGFRILIIENGGSQKNFKIWFSEVQKFLKIRILFDWSTYFTLYSFEINSLF